MEQVETPMVTSLKVGTDKPEIGQMLLQSAQKDNRSTLDSVMAYALHLPTLDSVLAAFADTHDGGMRQAVTTSQAGTQRDIRDLCSMWGVEPNKRNESGKRRKRRDEDLPKSTRSHDLPI